jgi:hypothetical protein
MIIPFSSEVNPSSIFTHFKTNQINADQGNYSFTININTKYLFVFASFAKDMTMVIESISKMFNKKIEIKSSRGDFDKTFINNYLTNYLAVGNIRFYFTPQMFKNRNRVVDHVIHTIQDMFYNFLFKDSILNRILYL